MGLLGMATYTTETRMKEISIRKILGSGSVALVLLLSRGFLKILAAAIALGVPVAYFVNSLWLDQIAYHTSLDIGAISTGVFILILFGTLTIGSQTSAFQMLKVGSRFFHDRPHQLSGLCVFQYRSDLAAPEKDHVPFLLFDGSFP